MHSAVRLQRVFLQTEVVKMSENVTVAFIGNPNCGKTTLFNAYTGARLKVANWPGVTVEKKEGAFRFHDDSFKLVDLPGIYSLTSYTMEEKLSRSFILGEDGGGGADVIVDVADASSLERNLYLTLQLIELGRPVVLALNMIDIVEKRGMEIDTHRLPEMLGIPVIPVSARRRTGLEVLMHAVAHHKDIVSDRTEHHHKSGSHRHDHHSELTLVYSDDLEDKIDRVAERLMEKYPDIKNIRWNSIKILEHDEDVAAKYKIDISDISKGSLEAEFTRQKFDFIEEVIEECLVNKEDKAQTTEKVDRILTHSIWGAPVFFGIMALVFLLTFTVGDAVKGIFESGLDFVSGSVLSWLTSIGCAEWLTSLIVDGIIAGVGGILTFLPNIFVLFLALAILEDSGYMSRVAYVMDGIMGRLGLSGRAFLPMLLGFGCTVPAVMASRALEDPRDRLKTIIVTPFMSCSARLPVYVLLSEMFFGKWAPLAALSMYALGLIVAIIIAKIISAADKKKAEHSLLIELPEYKMPSLRTVALYVWEKIKDYLSKAGTVIFIASIILWVVLNVGPRGMAADMGDSFGAYIGKFFAPVLRPCGLGMWQIAVALISGIAAKEVVVSSMSVVFGITNITSAAGMAGLSTLLASEGFTALNAYSLMVFVLLYIPCAATLGVIKSETKSTKMMIFAAVFQLFTAWAVSAVIYNIGHIFI